MFHVNRYHSWLNSGWLFPHNKSHICQTRGWTCQHKNKLFAYCDIAVLACISDNEHHLGFITTSVHFLYFVKGWTESSCCILQRMTKVISFERQKELAYLVLHLVLHLPRVSAGGRIVGRSRNFAISEWVDPNEWDGTWPRGICLWTEIGYRTEQEESWDETKHQQRRTVVEMTCKTFSCLIAHVKAALMPILSCAQYCGPVRIFTFNRCL